MNPVSASLHGIGPTNICLASGSLVMNQGHDTIHRGDSATGRSCETSKGFVVSSMVMTEEDASVLGIEQNQSLTSFWAIIAFHD
jgi:hypothetical protein